MRNKKPIPPQELALHLDAILRMAPQTHKTKDNLNPENTHMAAARLAMEYAIKTLLSAEPTTLDLANPDYGIPYALAVGQGEYPEKVKAAATLLRMCLHAIENGEIGESERTGIPMHLAALAEYVADQARRAARVPRPVRSELDALDRGLDDALCTNPGSDWANLADSLQGDGVVTTWNADSLTFTDGETEETIRIGTFQNRITNARKRRK